MKVEVAVLSITVMVSGDVKNSELGLACTAFGESGDAAGGGGPSRCQVFWTCSPWL